MSGNLRETYIAILRGINVSGKNMIKMQALVKAMEALAFSNVSSYIQSGNLIFDSNLGDEHKLAQLIHTQIKKEFTFEVPVLVIRPQMLSAIRDNNPFLKRNDIDTKLLHITFLDDTPDPDRISKIETEKYLPDEFQIEQKTVYLYCPTGYGKTKLHNGFFETKLNVSATTRNWNTVNKLIEMCE